MKTILGKKTHIFREDKKLDHRYHFEKNLLSLRTDKNPFIGYMGRMQKASHMLKKRITSMLNTKRYNHRRMKCKYTNTLKVIL